MGGRVIVGLVVGWVACGEPGPVRVQPEPATHASAAARATYDVALADLQVERARLGERFAAADERARAEVRREARLLLLRTFDDVIAPAWLGTPWAFSGTSNEPGRGEIACGHWVATVIRHLGFEVNRLRLGQLASEHIARTFVARSDLRRFSMKSAAEVLARVRGDGDGLYVLGLDRHAALLRVEGGVVTMCHASPGGVACEGAESAALFESRYRVTGKLLDDTMVDGWLAGRPFVLFSPQ